MKSIELLATGIRLLGIYIFIYAIRTGIFQYQAILQFRSTSQDDMEAFAYIALFQVGLLFIASLFMFKFPVSLSKWILPKTNNNEIIFDGTIKDIEVSLFVIIGVYILSWAIPDLFHNGIWWWYSAHSGISGISGMFNQGSENEHIINEVVTVIEIAIGLYLCLRAQGLSNLLKKFRQAGAR